MQAVQQQAEQLMPVMLPPITELSPCRELGNAFEKLRRVHSFLAAVVASNAVHLQAMTSFRVTLYMQLCFEHVFSRVQVLQQDLHAWHNLTATSVLHLHSC